MSGAQVRRWGGWVAWLGALALLGAGCGEEGEGGGAPAIEQADVGGSEEVGSGEDGGDGVADASQPEADAAEEPGGEITHRSVVPDGVRPEAITRLIVMGDSISAGVGARRDEGAYYALLQENAPSLWAGFDAVDLTTRYGHEVPLVNVAVPGATTRTLWRDQVPALREAAGAGFEGHSLVVITIGGNDLTTGFAAGADLEGDYLDETINFIKNTVEFLQDESVFPGGTSIFLANVYDPGDGVGRARQCFGGLDLSPASEALLVWARRYVDLAYDYNIGVVDALGAFRGHGFYSSDPENVYYDAADPTLWFDSDCIHPNDRGHHELRRLFFEAIDGVYVAD